MIKKMIFLSSLLLLAAGASAADRPKALKSVLQKALNCSNDAYLEKQLTLTPDEMAAGVYASVECFESVLADKLSLREKAGISSWLSAVDSVKKVAFCSGAEYQIKSYHAYTPYFLCVTLTHKIDGENLTRLIFFEKTKKGYSIASIYSPMNWGE